MAYPPLPADLLDGEARKAGRVFDTLASEYDASRPGYPAQAIASVVAACGLCPGKRVLEVGCGTGQATRPLAETGCAIRCLEPGANLASLARQNLRSLPNVEVVEQPFESADEPAGAYDAIVSATAFHWIDPQVSYAKAARLLGPGGHLALLTNAHAAGGTQDAIAGEVQKLHLRFAPDLGAWTFPSVEAVCGRATGDGDIAAVWSRVDRKLGDPPALGHVFFPPAVATYPWVASYDRAGYLAMLGTHSTYALMDARRREQLMEEMAVLIDDLLGGRITKQYVCVVAIAEVRS
ncbi:MAG: class I SAM-dependent methyltransferase [Acidimicrobiales bacterium]